MIFILDSSGFNPFPYKNSAMAHICPRIIIDKNDKKNF